MADAARRRPENAPGPLFVDATCIDCDTCRWMAPATFARRGGQSAVARQPQGADELRRAAQALVACPTASIGGAPPGEVAAAAAGFPVAIDPALPQVRHCGFHAQASFGATSYLVATPAGNVLVDSPRRSEALARRIEAMGGARLLALTHRDDVADHAWWSQRLGCARVLHERDGGDRLGQHGAEVVLRGAAPLALLPGFTAIPTPGHTAGHVCFHWDPQAAGAPGERGEAALFTGDHVAFDDEAGRLEAWPDVCWHDWQEQARSVALLAQWRASWVLPGHGRRGRMAPDDLRADLLRLAAWMRENPG